MIAGTPSGHNHSKRIKTAQTDLHKQKCRSLNWETETRLHKDKKSQLRINTNVNSNQEAIIREAGNTARTSLCKHVHCCIFTFFHYWFLQLEFMFVPLCAVLFNSCCSDVLVS